MQKALVTGASGFLGKYIVRQLLQDGFDTITMGRHGADYCCDLASQVPVLETVPQLVVHAAGKAHVVPKTPAGEKEFYQVNLQGTKKLAAAFDNLADWPQAFVFISTVAVYGRDEGSMIAESHPLEGSSPYARSKMEAEAFLTQWCQQHNIRLAILRLPLIAGANPPGNLGAMIKGIRSGRYFNIGKGDARKTMVMASDVARYISIVAAKGGIYNLSDGQHPSFAQLAALIARQLGKKAPPSIPGWLAGLLAFAGNFLGDRAPINTARLRKITATLTFDDSKARQAFGWSPLPVLDHFTIN